jgi:hypothetical protein
VIVTKPLDLELLAQEMTAASVPHRGLAHKETGSAVPNEVDLFTYDEDGMATDLPPEAGPVVDAHVAPPSYVDYVATRSVSAVLRTTDDQPHEVFRTTTKTKHVYAASFRMTAVDAGNGTTKRARAEMTFKGLAASVVQVGTTVASTPMQDTGAAGWVIQPSTAGADLIISVKGAAGRTVDWTLAGEVEVFSPEGLEA